VERVLCVVIGYAFGLIETGYIYGKFKHTDIREHGSGNAGTTNALRTFGAKGGAITFIGDFFKAVIALLVVGLIFANAAEPVKLYQMYAALGVILGHDFPVYMGFKGGKGIASSAGALVVVSPIAAVIGLACFVVIVAVSRYVSLGSIVGTIVLTVAFFVTGYMGFLVEPGQALIEMYVIMGVLAALALIKHRSNIVRLVKGCENKLNLHGKSEIS